MSKAHPHSVLPKTPKEVGIFAPTPYSQLSEEERKTLTEAELVEALAEESEDWQAFQEAKELQDLAEAERVELLERESSRSTTPDTPQPTPGPRSTTSSLLDSEE